MRAAIEFGKGAVVVPVAIVYNKSRYRSRVLVRYGSPILIQPTNEILMKMTQNNLPPPLTFPLDFVLNDDRCSMFLFVCSFVGNDKRLKHLLASYKILFALLPSSHSADITPEALKPYSTLPTPPKNPFIKAETTAGSGSSSARDETLSTEHTNPNRDKKARSRRRGVSSRMLIGHLFVARVEAVFALREFSYAVEDGKDGKEMRRVRYLRERGAKVC
ncbi:hypothetical protein PILCRDRAFT_8945 [Piloderma croceum F 1598]|uniref:Uncharacterized protein n=1 Tax=Piloderma croceum (strain F 1598) TaxID=765440 RepID=A0A0C3B4Y5_PILCF|nr:hypothetical protein PILCRDRAFT_8945 [Piloderma croceum F 1598]